jgi:hypothetical protein
MSAQLNSSEVRKMSDNQPVLCIPGVFANIKEERIRRIFGDLNIGDVDRVDFVIPKKPVGAEEKENKFNRVFVHVIWNDTPSSVACRKRLMEGKEVKIIYDTPWFWKVSAYRPPVPKPRFETQSKPRTFQPKKATLELDFEPAAKVEYSGVIASALTVPVPVSEPVQEWDAQGMYGRGPSSSQKRYDEFGAEITDNNPLDYGNLPTAPKKRKTKIITEEPAAKESENQK